MMYLIKIQFIRILSFITPKLIQLRRLEKIENRAKAIADKKNIPFLIRCRILEEHQKKPDSFTSIGFSFQYEQMSEGKYTIYIYRQSGMASELELLKTIFHEYGHFIDYCTSVQTKKPLKYLYYCNKFPGNWFGKYDEDFAELFSWYMLDLIQLDNDTFKMMDAIVGEGLENLSDGAMKRAIDLRSI